MARACLLPAPKGHHALLVATHFDGGHRDRLGCHVLGPCCRHRAHRDGSWSSDGLGVDLVGASRSAEFKDGACTIGHYSGCDAGRHDHVPVGSVIHDDASTRGFG